MGSSPGPLSVEGLFTHIHTRDGVVKALNGVSFDVRSQEILGLVGETGSGKSLTADSIMGLVRAPGKIVAGSIRFDGEELTSMTETELSRLRGRRIAFVPQHAKSALNPLMTARDQLLNVYGTHLPLARKELEEHLATMLRDVGFADPSLISTSYPHQLSGGMAQRVVLAMALGTSPELVIADEPTSGLDARIQVTVLSLMQRLLKESGSSAILITHDLGVVAQYCDRVAVMHAGQIVEIASVRAFFGQPKHPYSAGLLNALMTSPDLHGGIRVTGLPPDLRDPPPGCLYRHRCPLAAEICEEHEPAPVAVGPDHWSRCHRVDDLVRNAG